MSQFVTTVWATLAMPAFHHWPNAPDHRAYLRAEHRHLFVLRAEVAVDHDDRQVEVHDLQDAMASWWHRRWPSTHPSTESSWARACGSASCERLAAELAAHLGHAGYYAVRVDVSEDGECGATVTTQHRR